MSKIKQKMQIAYKLVNQIADKLKVVEGPNYEGLYSVAAELVRIYINKNSHLFDYEYPYYIDIFRHYLTIDISMWLTKQHRHTFGNKNLPFLIIDIFKEIKEDKKKIYKLWKKDLLSKELEWTKNEFLNETSKPHKERLLLYISMLGELNDLYPIYLKSLEHQFKKEIGLC